MAAGTASTAGSLGKRQCPGCGAVSPILAGEPLWPPDWACPHCGEALSRRGDFVRLAPALDEGDEGYDIESFAFLANVESRHFWFRARNDLIGWLARRFAPGARRALEIGCGTGFVLGALKDALPEARLAGSELHGKGLSIARRRHAHDVELFQMDARRSGLIEAVDVVGAFDVLEHIEEDGKVLADCARMLRPGGVLIATVPQHPWLWGAQDELARHVRRYRRGELAARAAEAGLVPVYGSSFVVLAFPMMAASRLARGKGADAAQQRQHVESEFEISPALNRVMLGLMTIEQAIRRTGMPLPFGGSQVLVATKPRD